MERLTKRVDGGVVFPSELLGISLTPDNECMHKLLTKLAAYEDTGLEPEEIDRIVDAYGRGITLRTESAKRLELMRDILTEHLKELAQAEKDGRLVILQPNDPLAMEELREMDGDKIYVHYIDGFYTDEDGAYFGKFEQLVRECNGKLTACELPLEHCGKTWLAYRHEPEEGTI